MTSACDILVRIWPLAMSLARLDVLRSRLSPEERERAAKFRIASLAHEFIISHGIMRELLALDCACDPSVLVFQLGAHGKPNLKRPTGGPSFSLSHSGGTCALATTSDRELGVDIERIGRIEADLARTCFTAREAAQLSTMPPQERTRAFFRSWVIKEAYLKATGEGLTGGLDSLELAMDGSRLEPIAVCGSAAEARAWSFAEFDAATAVVGAVAVRTGDRALRLHVRHIDPEQPIGRVA